VAVALAQRVPGQLARALLELLVLARPVRRVRDEQARRAQAQRVPARAQQARLHSRCNRRPLRSRVAAVAPAVPVAAPSSPDAIGSRLASWSATRSRRSDRRRRCK